MTDKLAELLNYTNQPIINYFCHNHPQTNLNECNLLFKDLLAWMWLKKQRDQMGKKTYLFGPLLSLDEMWHDFILHTRDYIDFCMHYFGEYLHHDVEPPGFEHHIDEAELRDYLDDCLTYLDQDWVERRFIAALTDSP